MSDKNSLIHAIKRDWKENRLDFVLGALAAITVVVMVTSCMRLEATL